MAGMIEALLEIVGLIVLIAVADWLGISYEVAELIAATIVGCALLIVVVRSAYRDACGRQRWPGKNQSRHFGARRIC
jgi:UPF0716 family protein affecting phage T7 exclusion